MNIIKARAPFRLGLAGGGSDLSPYCDIYGGYVVNCTLDRYCYTVIKTLDEPNIRFRSIDNNLEANFSLELPLILNGEFNLHKAVYNYMIDNFNNCEPISIEISTFSEAPAGSGLGSSSTLVVSMIQAFIELLGISIDKKTLAEIAFFIERIECNLKGGKQDQYSSAIGGINFFEFYKNNKVVVNPIELNDWFYNEIQSSILLFSTNVSRNSEKIISDQQASIETNSDEKIKAMHSIKYEASVLRDAMLNENITAVVNAIKSGWQKKKLSSSYISNEYFDEIYDSSINAGALAGKISGAGGGGFMWFFVPIENRANVIKNLSRYNGIVSNCNFTKKGSVAWRVL